MQRIFLTHIVPRDKVLEYNLSMAGVNFCYNLMGDKTFDKVYSILPSFVHRTVKPFDGLIFSSLRLKGKLAVFAPLVENIRLFKLIPSNASIWYYNCTILNALLIILLKVFKPKVKQQMIILDFIPNRTLLENFYLWLSNKMDGTIRLANSPLFTVKNSVCLPGVTPINTPDYPQIESIKKEFLISGSLNYNIAMLPMLLEAFSKLPDMKLHITGRSTDDGLIKQYTEKYKNIIYHGLLDYDKYLELLHNIPFQLSTRNPQSEENQCNFPSKVIEALLHNRIIISTMHYEQLNGIHYFEISSKEEKFREGIKEIISMPIVDLMKFANQESLIKEKFNCNIWKNIMQKIENS